jgi:endonuclease-3
MLRCVGFLEEAMSPLTAEKIQDLLRQADQIIEQCRNALDFETGNPEAERMLRDLKNFPHHFVLACVMDRQIKASRAWIIPYHVGLKIGGFDFENYEKLGLNAAKALFQARKLHRFNDVMAKNFVGAVGRIRSKYNGDASQIWAGTPLCARVIRAFLEFNGVGIKIATMATNILVRQFGICMKEKSAIDISPDVQVMKYFKEQRLLREEASIPELIYLARELSPDYPGRLDAVAWRGGRAIKRTTRRTTTTT